MTTNTAAPTVRISRRGFRPQIASARLSAEMPCLHPDVALIDMHDTGR